MKTKDIFIYCFTLQMAVMAGTGPGTSSGSAISVQGNMHLSHYLMLSQAHFQRAALDVEQQHFNLHPLAILALHVVSQLCGAT